MLITVNESIEFMQALSVNRPSKLDGGSKTANVARATCSSFFEKFKKCILKFSKNLKLILHMGNDEIYKRAKFQLKIPYNIGCAKITKPDICSSEQCKLSKRQNLSDFIIFMELRI
jgi:hypothetical protein